jgi:hypothetical protein
MTAIGNPTVLEQPGLKSTEITIHNLRNCDYRTETDYANWLGVGVISMQTASTSKSEQQSNCCRLASTVRA